MFKSIAKKIKLAFIAILFIALAMSFFSFFSNRVVAEDYLYTLGLYTVLMISAYFGITPGLIVALLEVLFWGAVYFYETNVTKTRYQLSLKEIVWMFSFPVGAGLGGYLGNYLMIIDKLFKRYSVQIESLIKTGQLGMLGNENTFQQSLKEECSRAKRALSQFALFVLEIGNVEALEKIFGLDAVSEATKKVSEVLCHTTRDIDKKALLDESLLALILPDTSRENSTRTLERIEERLARVEMEYRGRSIKPHIQLKYGLAMFPEDGKTAEELSKAAKANLKVTAKKVRTDNKK
ncbi:MAG: diguanylate cyclase [Candidatus Omnitrophica bacterium]|nr:diguanylate cyclase [Candidatus Omnitrophota bacterium]